MKRFGLSLVLSLFAFSAFAGNASQLNVLGFSQDGRVFAFEEFGRQDGSGFPYANRFYIDTTNDSFLAGTPIRVRIENETATLPAVRMDAKSKGEAAAKITDMVLLDNPGELLAFNPITEISANPLELTFHNQSVYQEIAPSRSLKLTVTEEAPGENCYGMADKQAKIALDISVEGTVTRLHDDKSVPASRNCPTGYRLGGVVRMAPAGGTPVLVVLVQVQSIGFEGPDYRWIAITKADPAP